MVRGQPRPICKHCSYDCLTCNQYGECLTCNASEYRKLNPKNSRCQPLKGYYDDRSFVCKKCHYLCLDCRTQYDCNECIEGYYFEPYESQCVPVVNQFSKMWIIVPGVVFLVILVVISGAIWRYVERRKE